jgi:hypothetical protein
MVRLSGYATGDEIPIGGRSSGDGDDAAGEGAAVKFEAGERGQG